MAALPPKTRQLLERHAYLIQPRHPRPLELVGSSLWLLENKYKTGWGLGCPGWGQYS